MTIDPLRHPACLAPPRRVTPGSGWHEHIPFGMFLVSLLRPALVVELGTHRGDSYCALCQAVQALELPARCYGIDTWQGDPHAGHYGPEVLQELREHHDPLYGRFSGLIQSTFDGALGRFEDGTIDLLHIDGYHAYEAVRHDFEAWLPKMSPRGVVLLHDTRVRENDFGVWKLWEEIHPRFPSLELEHGHGLGVLAAGAEPPPAFRELASLPPRQAAAFRDLFRTLGERLSLQVRNAGLTSDCVRLDRALHASRGELDHCRGEIDRLRRELLSMRQRREWQWIERYHRLKSRLMFRA